MSEGDDVNGKRRAQESRGTTYEEWSNSVKNLGEKIEGILNKRKIPFKLSCKCLRGRRRDSGWSSASDGRRSGSRLRSSGEPFFHKFRRQATRRTAFANFVVVIVNCTRWGEAQWVRSQFASCNRNRNRVWSQSSRRGWCGSSWRLNRRRIGPLRALSGRNIRFMRWNFNHGSRKTRRRHHIVLQGYDIVVFWVGKNMMNRLNKQNTSIHRAILIGSLKSKLVRKDSFQLVSSFRTFGNDVFFGDNSRLL